MRARIEGGPFSGIVEQASPFTVAGAVSALGLLFCRIFIRKPQVHFSEILLQDFYPKTASTLFGNPAAGFLQSC
jgi:hypothetical protein